MRMPYITSLECVLGIRLPHFGSVIDYIRPTRWRPEEAAPQPWAKAGLTTSTGVGEFFTTFSVTEPKNLYSPLFSG